MDDCHIVSHSVDIAALQAALRDVDVEHTKKALAATSVRRCDGCA